MKMRSLTPKANSVLDLKTTESQSNLNVDHKTHIKKVFLPQ